MYNLIGYQLKIRVLAYMNFGMVLQTFPAAEPHATNVAHDGVISVMHGIHVSQHSWN